MINKDIVKILSMMQNEILGAIQNGVCYELANQVYNMFEDFAEYSNEPELLKKTAEQIKKAEEEGKVEQLFEEMYNSISFFISNLNYNIDFIEDNVNYLIVIELPYNIQYVTIGCDYETLTIYVFGVELVDFTFPKQVDKNSIKIDHKNGVISIRAKKI